MSSPDGEFPPKKPTIIEADKGVRVRQYLIGFTIGILISSLIFFLFFPSPQPEKTTLVDSECPEPIETECPPCPTLEELLAEQPEPEPEIIEPPAPDVILPPPEYAADLPPSLQTRHPGEVLIAWDEVLGGARYRVSVYGPDGEVITTRTTTHRRMYLQRIPYAGGEAPFVDYSIRLSTMNANGVYGPEGPRRSLRVLQQHGHIQLSKEQADPLIAPEIESIVIED